MAGKREIAGGQKSPNFGVRIGGLCHDVAPVAPHRLEIEDHEALFGRRTGEQIVAPSAPFGSLCRRQWRCRKCGNGDGGGTDEFHGGSPSVVVYRATRVEKIRVSLSPFSRETWQMVGWAGPCFRMPRPIAPAP